jgi:hypothetical protein
MPLFRSQNMLALWGMIQTKDAVQAFEKDPAPEHWTRMFQDEVRGLLNDAMAGQMLDEQDLTELARRWLRTEAAEEVRTPADFAEAMFSGGMEIDPESPFMLVRRFLEAKQAGDTSRVERILEIARGTELSETAGKEAVQYLVGLDPMERLEMILANLALTPTETVA